MHESYSAEQLLSWAVAEFGRDLAVATSFQKEGMVLIDMASRIEPSIRVFTVDTGRLPETTYEMIEGVRRRYGIAVETVAPDAAEIESMVAAHGPNLFYREASLRMLCCHVRKVRPLERKLGTLRAWVAGLRRSQTAERSVIPKVDASGKAVKICPLADWSAEQVDRYILEHDVPVHPLYARGYASIGCAPCTRATAAGENERDGRWWWEQETAKECGIHFTPDGRVSRRLDVLVGEVLASRHA